MDHTSIVFGSSISSPSLTTESPEVYNSDAQSPIYGSLDDIGTFSGNGDQDIDGNMYHTSGTFGSSQYSPSLAAESSEGYNSDAQSSICDDYGTFGGNSDRDGDGNMDDDDAAEDDDEHVIDDDVFNAVVHHEIAQNAANERERGELLNPESCRSAVNFICSCQMPCCLRCEISAEIVFDARSDTLSLSNDGHRLLDLAKKLKVMRTETPSQHPAAALLGKRKANSRATKQHFDINNVDVCAEYFGLANGLSPSLIERAAKLAGEAYTDINGKLTFRTKKLIVEPADRLYIARWFEEWTVKSSAESLPLGDAPGLVRGVQEHPEGAAGADTKCILRLHEYELTQLYLLYQKDCANRFKDYGIKVFREVFHAHPRCALFKLARKKDNFGECSDCSNFKAKLSNHKCPPVEREEAQNHYGEHIALMNLERYKYVRRASKPSVDKSGAERIPPIININIAVSLFIDKMTKQTTGVPALKPSPKCVNGAHRLFIAVTGIVVHGVGFFCCQSTDAQSGGANLTIECIDRCLRSLQSNGYRFGPRLFVQADNHTDNKTPVVLFYLANLVRLKIFIKSKLTTFIRGHGHGDGDQKYSVLSAKIKKRNSLVISPIRLYKSLRGAFLSDSAKPTLISVDGVHDWARYFKSSIEALSLGRLACAEDGGESQHCYTLTAGESSVKMVYKRFSSQKERYPRELNVGDAVTVASGAAGQVTETEYLPDSRAWNSTVLLYNGGSESVTHPVVGIDMFPTRAYPIGLPAYEPMDDGWQNKVSNIERNIKTCQRKLPAYFAMDDTVNGEWDAWFKVIKENIAVCKEMGLAWYQGDEAAELMPSAHTRLAIPATPTLQQGPLLFSVDPVTHVAFTDQQRQKAMGDSRRAPHLVPGVYVLLRLRYNSVGVPESHQLPCCIGTIPDGFSLASHPDGGVVCFSSMFTKCPSMSGTWTPQGTISAPLTSILYSGLTLTAARKITAASQARISAVVPVYETVAN